MYLSRISITCPITPSGAGPDRPPLDVALLHEDPRELRLQFGGGDLDGLVRRVDRVADAREEVGYRIGHRHGRRLPCERVDVVGVSVAGGMDRVDLVDLVEVVVDRAYQEDFVIPGIWPLWASSRKQMRQSPNLR